MWPEIPNSRRNSARNETGQLFIRTRESIHTTRCGNRNVGHHVRSLGLGYVAASGRSDKQVTRLVRAFVSVYVEQSVLNSSERGN